MARRLGEFLTLLASEERSGDETEIGSYVTWLRRRVALLKYIPTKDVIEVIRQARHIHADRNEVLFQQTHHRDSSEPSSFFIILRGSVSMFLNPFLKQSNTGRTTAVSIERSFLSGGSRSDTLTAKLTEPPKSAASKKTTGSKRSTSTYVPLKEDSDSNISDVDSEVSIPSDDVVTAEPISAPELVVSVETRNSQSQASKASTSRMIRSKLGKFVVKYEKGKYFDEGGILNEESDYTASIIADENTELLLLDHQSFNKFVKQQHEKEVTKLTNFVDIHPFFCDLPLYSKGVIQISLRSDNYNAGDIIVKQGEPITRLLFIISGSAEVIVEPNKHRYQYPHLWPFETSNDVYFKECEWLRESRRRIHSRKYDFKGEVRQRKHRSKAHKPVVSVCAIQNKEVIGITEFALGLQTYIQSIRCLHDCEILWLNVKPFGRIVKRRNPEIMDLIHSYIYMKLQYRIANTIGDQVPLFQSLLSLAENRIPKQSNNHERMTKSNRKIKEHERAVLEMLSWFRLDKSPLLLNRDPGIIKLKEGVKEKAALREKLRQRYVGKPFHRIGCLATVKHARAPRSFNQLRNLLDDGQDRLDTEDETSDGEDEDENLDENRLSKISETQETESVDIFPRGDTVLVGQYNVFRSRRHGNRLIRRFQDMLQRGEMANSPSTAISRAHGPVCPLTVKFGGLTPVDETENEGTHEHQKVQREVTTLQSRSSSCRPVQFEHRMKTPDTLSLEIRDFHQKYGGTSTEIRTLPRLKKVEEPMFSLDDKLIRGGTVLVTRTKCVSCSQNIRLKNHNHIRCQMLRPIPWDIVKESHE